MTIRVRPARAVEVPAVRDIVHAAYEPYRRRLAVAPAPLLADDEAIISAMACMVAIDGDRGDAIVGVLVMWPHPDHLLVENVAVHPVQQGRGIGALLLAYAEREAVALGLPSVRLYTNELMTENLAWYPSRGYSETGRRQDGPYRRVRFEKLLASPIERPL
ncbi:GNAT family N-acetyltransferase [uncultured Amnibacterium sp.]|uniref:GNAT family N-acetyltransferase n=1 Tax=uncultured Amnibacterium sp. TaxID=1631851 RepID=UPI0035CAF25B